MNKMIDFLISVLVLLLLLKLVLLVFKITVKSEKAFVGEKIERQIQIYNPDKSIDIEFGIIYEK